MGFAQIAPRWARSLTGAAKPAGLKKTKELNMRTLIQRITKASVTVDGAMIGRSGPGLVILICAMQGDGEVQVARLANKVANLRIFKDESGKMNRSILDVKGSALVVSQFTLAADTSRGNRPGFSAAAPAEEGEQLYEAFVRNLVAAGIPVETGAFGADMAVELVNDGPVTIWMES